MGVCIVLVSVPLKSLKEGASNCDSQYSHNILGERVVHAKSLMEYFKLHMQSYPLSRRISSVAAGGKK